MCICGHSLSEHKAPEVKVEAIEIDEEGLETVHKTHVSKPIQNVIHRHIIREKSGLIVGITGRPNFGKSWTGNKLILDWNPNLSIDDYLTYEVDEIFEKTFANLKINGKPMTKEEFDRIPTNEIKQWCRENIETVSIKMGRALLVDEAGAAIYNRDFFSPENKAMAKLVQVWRFMRMLVIFVIPEKVEFLEKTLREFFDLKIIMLDKNEEEGYAKAIAKERKGRNYKDEPIFARINGCKNGGFIKIRPFSIKWPEAAKEYERRSKIFKASIIMMAWRDVQESNGQMPQRLGKRKFNINELVEQAESQIKELTVPDKRTGKPIISEALIQSRIGISAPKARIVKVELEAKKARSDMNNSQTV